MKEIVEKIKYMADTNPAKLAICMINGETLSWGELHSRVLMQDSLTPVYSANFDIIYADRSIDTIVSILRDIVFGRNYVLIDPELPAERINSALEAVEGLNGQFVEESVYFGIFTSGSTGTPKLVIKSVEQIWNFIETYCKTFGFNSNDVFGNQVPFYFDAFGKDMFSMLFLGATLVIIPKHYFASPMMLIEGLNETGITVTQWVPSAYAQCVVFNVFEEIVPTKLHTALFVGETMPVSVLKAWQQALPDCRFVNLYGSSEVAGNSCYYVVKGKLDNDSIIPIGKPFEGYELRVENCQVEDSFSIQDANETIGQLVVKSSAVAYGYLNDLEASQKVFQNGSFYTGDMVKVDKDGNYIFAGRMDNIVKYMGYRINLLDIENAIQRINCVNEACVVLSEKEQCLKAFAVINQYCGVVVAEKNNFLGQIRKELMGVLPKYMLPKKIEILEAIPKLKNGKKDRILLRRL